MNEVNTKFMILLMSARFRPTEKQFLIFGALDRLSLRIFKDILLLVTTNLS